MRKVGVYSAGGGVHARLKNQMQRLFHSQVELSYEDAHGERFVASRVADSGEFWWDAKHPDQSSLWESKIELGEKFFQEIIAHPIPLDLHTLKSLKRSPLGLDLYLWLTYRTFGLTRPLRLTSRSQPLRCFTEENPPVWYQYPELIPLITVWLARFFSRENSKPSPVGRRRTAPVRARYCAGSRPGIAEHSGRGTPGEIALNPWYACGPR